MRSALLPLSIQVGCCRSRQPTVWDQLIAGSVYVRRAHRIDANLFPTASTFAIAAAILRPVACSAVRADSLSPSSVRVVSSRPISRAVCGCVESLFDPTWNTQIGHQLLKFWT
jgi:hypothetical protein